MIRLSNNPIVGQWVVLRDIEACAVSAALTDTQRADITNGGYAIVSYVVVSVRWNNQIIKRGQQ